MPRDEELNSYIQSHGDGIKKEYKDGKSMREIAKEYGTYTQKIYRVLLKMKVPLRDKSEAQKIALKEGRSVHPTEGKHLSPDQKKALGIAISAAYENSTEEERQKRSESARKRYNERTDEERHKLRRRAGEAILEASVKGSKLERFLLDKLTLLGYSIVFHKKGYILNSHLEIDLLIPSLKVAIEVDGIFHSKDVWNNGSLAKVQSKDGEKNALLLQNGYVVIRLSNTAGSCSQYYMRSRLNVLTDKLEEIKKNFPPLEDRLIYLGE